MRLSDGIRKFLYWVIVGACFLCLDTVVPFLRVRNLAYLWWLLLLLLIWGAYKTSSGGSRADRFDIITFVLLGVTVFLYDPTLQPALARVGLEKLWIASGCVLAIWIVFGFGA
jgi:hypothetical protein